MKHFSKKLDPGLRRYDGRGIWYRYPSIVTPMKIGVQLFVAHEQLSKRLDTSLRRYDGVEFIGKGNCMYLLVGGRKRLPQYRL